MKKLNENLLIARGEFTTEAKWILSRVNLFSCDRLKKAIHVVALWDTGSMYNGVSNKLADALGLEKVGIQRVRYGDNVMKSQPVYRADILFLDSGKTFRWEFVGFDNEDQDVVIGMEAIRYGRFLIEPMAGGFTFTFEKKK